MPILTSDKVEFKAKKFIRKKEVHYIMMKGSIHPKDTAILNMHAPKKHSCKNVKQEWVELKKEKKKSTVIVGDFKTPLDNW